ncbi:MAG: HEAT repeat domain-containing protein [Promethearchaeota archaeon]
MAWFDIILPFTYLILGLMFFILGFMLVYNNLRKVNLIEGEKFSFEDWRTCIIFGLMFSLTTVFILNLTLEFFFPSQLPFIGDYLLVILLLMLFIYPLWDMFYLARPTSDAVHDFHTFLETHIFDRVRDERALLVSLGVFSVMYIAPILIISQILNVPMLDIAFIWFLIFPLFFLSTYAALGQVGNIISFSFAYTIPKNVTRGSTLLYMMKRVIGIIIIIIAWVPFFIAIYNVYSPVATILGGGGLEQKAGVTAILSLFTTVVFGIQGFFNKFWNRKSKTRIIDFIFGGYIFIAIGVNMLINFMAINPSIVENILNASIFGAQPLLTLMPLMKNYAFIMPLIIVQSIVIVIYDIILLLRRNSEFHADMRLNAVNRAFGIKIERLIKAKKAAELKKKYNLEVLFKAILVPPVFTEEGMDIHEEIRRKAAQCLYIIASDNKSNADHIVDVLTQNTIEMVRKNLKNVTDAGKEFLNAKKTKIFTLDWGIKFMKSFLRPRNVFISKEALDLIGDIGELYPDIVLQRLLDGLNVNDTRLREFILDALGDIGSHAENIKMVVHSIKPFLVDKSYGIRVAAINSLTEMVTTGPYMERDFTAPALETLYEILEKYKEQPMIIETTLQGLLNLCGKIADQIDFDRVVPFLDYQPPLSPSPSPSPSGLSIEEVEESVEYILQFTLQIIGATVYYNVEKFPLEKVMQFAESQNPYIRRVACDAIGNFILKTDEPDKINAVLQKLYNHSLYDDDPDVIDMAIESIAEFLILNRDFKIKDDDGTEHDLYEKYTGALDSDERRVRENASEALKNIVPIYKERPIDALIEKIKNDEGEVARDLLHMLGDIPTEMVKNMDFNIIYEKLGSKDPETRAAALYALGSLGKDIDTIDHLKVIKMLNDSDPQVRMEAIFALGKIGQNTNPTKHTQVVKALIQNFYKLDKEALTNVSETELYAESLGIIGSIYPSNEIIITLQQALMGNTNVYAKDVVAKALWNIGNGMIKSGKATKRFESPEFYKEIPWFRTYMRKEYSIGNIIIIFIEAIQQKGIPESVMNIISDGLQDLLPVFTFVKNERRPAEILNTIKILLAQAYYSNYDQEILETIDRINSLISFKAYCTKEDKYLREQGRFFTIQYTPDGKQFFDQGVTFMHMASFDRDYLEYAYKSFEIALELAPNEYYSPDTLFKMGEILEMRDNINEAIDKFKAALELYEVFDEIDSMNLCQERIQKLRSRL